MRWYKQPSCLTSFSQGFASMWGDSLRESQWSVPTDCQSSTGNRQLTLILGRALRVPLFPQKYLVTYTAEGQGSKQPYLDTFANQKAKCTTGLGPRSEWNLNVDSSGISWSFSVWNFNWKILTKESPSKQRGYFVSQHGFLWHWYPRQRYSQYKGV